MPRSVPRSRALGYGVGDSLVIAQGASRVRLVEHDDEPSEVSGIPAPTGAALDRSFHVSLEGIEGIAVDWKIGVRTCGLSLSPDRLHPASLRPKSIADFLMGLDSKLAIFSIQRHINELEGEPLLVMLPGVALQELWDLIGVTEQLLCAVSVMAG